MTKSIKVTTTKTEGWQAKCLDWAVAEEYFEIQGIGARHLAFCKELCDIFSYECLYESAGKKSTAVFTPLPP
jgi:hypothetical protein